VKDRRTETVAGGLVRGVRPKQWVKNLLVFAAPGAAGVLDQAEPLADTLVAFGAFCLAASGTYLLNDVADREADARHPTKRNRPVASGLVPPDLAVAVAVPAVVASIALSLVADWHLSVVVGLYVVVTTTYSRWLKHVVILDLVAVAAGFVLRAIGGAAATGVPVSDWFFIVTSFGSLFVVTGKRQGEAGDLAEVEGRAGDIRRTLDAYSASYLAYLRTLSSAVVFVAYCVWAFEAAAVAGDSVPWFELSILPFTVAVLRYALLLDQGRGADPEDMFFGDRPLQLAGLAWALVYGTAVYLT
jgi:decaprenyl-phosphate phosphoribosyltransferase